MSNLPPARSRLSDRHALAALASALLLLSSACSSSVATSGASTSSGAGASSAAGGSGGSSASSASGASSASSAAGGSGGSGAASTSSGSGGSGGSGASGSGGSPSELPTSAAVERTVLWTGYYPDTSTFMASLAPADIGPTIASSPGHITVGWKALAYEDCREPKTIAIAARPDLDSGDRRGFSAIFEPPGGGLCNDTNFVSDATATFEAPAGSYTFFIDTLVDGFWFDNADGKVLDVDVQAP